MRHRDCAGCRLPTGRQRRIRPSSGAMTEPTHPGSRRLVLLLRGVRARLAATYLAAAIVLAAGGVALFSFFFERGLLANVDDSLASRADATAADVASSSFPDEPHRTPTIRRRPSRSLARSPRFTARRDTLWRLSRRYCPARP